MQILTRFFLENRKFSYVVTFLFAAFGVLSLFQINSEEFPSVDIGTAIITTRYPGASASEVETKITKPIEDEVRGVRGVKDVRSLSKSGFSKVVVRVDIDHYDTQEVMSDLQRAVDRTKDLPTDLDELPSFQEVKSEEFPVIEMAVIGGKSSRFRNEVADQLKEDLEDNPSIVEVVLSGYAERQFNIYLDPAKLQAFNIGVDEVISKVQARNITVPGGELGTSQEEKLLRIEGKIKSAQELEMLVLRANFSGKAVLLGDVSRVEDAEEELEVITQYENQAATLLSAKKKSGTDIRELSRAIQDKVSLYREKYKDELDFKIFFNSGLQVDTRLSVLGSNAVVGLFLVFVFLLLFLPGRNGIMAGLSLPIAMLATIGFMSSVGYSLNSMTILALIIALGMLVDNAVVVAENAVHLKKSGMSSKDALYETIRLLWFPITATALTTVFAFVPMLVTTGVVGQFIKSLPVVVTFALIFSLFEAFFLLPVRLDAERKSRNQEKEDWFTRKIIPKFEGFMLSLVKHRYLTFVGYSLILVFSIVLLVFANKLILFPQDQTKHYIMRLEMPVGSPVELTSETLKKLAVQVREKLGDGAQHITSRAGESSTDPSDPKEKNGANFGILHVYLTEEMKNEVPVEEVLSRLRSIKIEGADRISSEAEINGPPIGDPVSLSFRSNDAQSLKAVTKSLEERLNSVDGIFDVRINDVIGAPEVFVEVDYQKASRLGLDLSLIGNTLRAAIAGVDISDVNLKNKEVDLFLQMDQSGRRNLLDLASVRVREPQGNLIPISNIAKFETKDGEAQILRVNYKRAKTLTANIDTDKITAFDANKIALTDFEALQDQYPNVSVDISGEGESTQESMQSLFKALILSIMGIFALLVLLFGSYLRPIIVLSTIPLGLVGVSVAFFLQDRPISFLALIGILGLGGIIVNTGIVLISFIEELKRQNGRSLTDIVVAASVRRLRAVIVTSLTTVAGLLPTAYGIGGADEFIIPMALALAWGLTSGTILALFWIPCAYMILEDFTLLIDKLKSRLRKQEDVKVVYDAEKSVRPVG